MLYEEIKNQIVERLKKAGVEKIILFGSHAWGEPHKDSDMDLYVVTGDEYMPENFKEKSDIYLRIISLLDDIQGVIPIDMIVHTKPMYEKFIKLNGMFCRKILRDGLKLYETANQ